MNFLNFFIKTEKDKIKKEDRSNVVVTLNEVTVTNYFFDNFIDNCITFFLGYNDNKFYSYFYCYFAHKNWTRYDTNHSHCKKISQNYIYNRCKNYMISPINIKKSCNFTKII